MFEVNQSINHGPVSLALRLVICLTAELLVSVTVEYFNKGPVVTLY